MIREKYSVYPKAFKEIYEIINYFPRSEYKKIPKSFITFIKENMDNNYDYIVRHVDDFQNQEMLDETKIILAILYREYIASSKEKMQIYEIEKSELIQEAKKIEEEYNQDNLFGKKATKSEKIENSVGMVEYKESFFTKIKKWFKRIFRK